MSIRLINTKTLELEVFMGEEVPPYAILSHTWAGKEEVSLQEFEALFADDSHRSRAKSGFKKIQNTCARALQDGHAWAWVDTCCIDKSSSAELNEAINSMFRWYKEAQVCYAYLADLPMGSDIEVCLPDCRWFTRGWCLQELIAPKEVIFLDSAWQEVGSRSGLKSVLRRITKIDESVLEKSDVMYKLPIARRMSWAAMRNTTRVEDKAYCLLGLFDVNMPMLYGEGNKAFLRLQEEIIKRSNDLSIFLNSSTIDESPEDRRMREEVYGRWTSPWKTVRWLPAEVEGDTASETDNVEIERMAKSYRWPYRNLFARSPRAFLHCHDVVFSGSQNFENQLSRDSHDDQIGFGKEVTFAVHQDGLHLSIQGLHQVKRDPQKGYQSEALPQNCYAYALGSKKAKNRYFQDFVILKKVGPNVFVRLRNAYLNLGWHYFKPIGASYEGNTEITIKTIIDPGIIAALDGCHHYALRFSNLEGYHLSTSDPDRFRLVSAMPLSSWEEHNSRFLTGGRPFRCYLKIGLSDHPSLLSFYLVVALLPDTKLSGKHVPNSVGDGSLHLALCTEEQWDHRFGKLFSELNLPWGSDDQRMKAFLRLLVAFGEDNGGSALQSKPRRPRATLRLGNKVIEALGTEASRYREDELFRSEHLVQLSSRAAERAAPVTLDSNPAESTGSSASRPLSG